MLAKLSEDCPNTDAAEIWTASTQNSRSCKPLAVLLVSYAPSTRKDICLGSVKPVFSLEVRRILFEVLSKSWVDTKMKEVSPLKFCCNLIHPCCSVCPQQEYARGYSDRSPCCPSSCGSEYHQCKATQRVAIAPPFKPAPSAVVNRCTLFCMRSRFSKTPEWQGGVTGL